MDNVLDYTNRGQSAAKCAFRHALAQFDAHDATTDFPGILPLAESVLDAYATFLKVCGPTNWMYDVESAEMRSIRTAALFSANRERLTETYNTLQKAA